MINSMNRREQTVQKFTAVGSEFRLQAVFLSEPRKRGTPNVQQNLVSQVDWA
jgi:hypothetical protein